LEMTRRQQATLVLMGIAGALLFGPRAELGGTVSLPPLPTNSADLDDWVRANQAKVSGIRPGDQSQLTWAGPAGTPTPLALVYLHGYSASPVEIEPVMSQLAAQLGANLYRPRLSGHGLEPGGLEKATAAEWIAESHQAITLGSMIGHRVVVVGASTGGTLAAISANQGAKADALILVNPNFGPQAKSAELLLLPWGSALLPRLVPSRSWEPSSPEQGAHWTTAYALESLVQMMLVVKESRNQDYRQLDLPVLVMRSDADDVVDQAAIEAFVSTLPNAERIVVDHTEGEDGHVLAGEITAPSRVQESVVAMQAFILGL
jgi:alpha-beta hydrolase superfamily lysophospholipase